MVIEDLYPELVSTPFPHDTISYIIISYHFIRVNLSFRYDSFPIIFFICIILFLGFPLNVCYSHVLLFCALLTFPRIISIY